MRAKAMELGQTRSGAGLLFAITLLGCDRGAPVAVDGPASSHEVVIDLGTLGRPPAAGVQGTCVSVVAEAVLRVGPEGGTLRELRSDVPAEASTIRFDAVDVEQGPVSFSVSILSENGTELYGKDTSAQIDASTFSIAIPVDKRAPVLQVCPGHITLDRAGAFRATLRLRNRGIGTLTYQAVSPDCEGGPCIGFDLPAGTVGPSATGALVDSLDRMAPVGSLELRVESPAGSVPVLVTLGQIPDIVVDAFEATDTLRVNQLGQFELPVSVTVRNDGNTAAAIFKVAAEYTNEGGSTFATAFAVQGGDGFYAFTGAPLEPGGRVTLDGSVLWPDFVGGQEVQLRMEGDSCSGDEDQQDYCRIDEFKEVNNFSQDISVPLPSNQIP